MLAGTAASDDPRKRLAQPHLAEPGFEERAERANIPVLHVLGVIAEPRQMLTAEHVADAEVGLVRHRKHHGLPRDAAQLACRCGSRARTAPKAPRPSARRG